MAPEIGIELATGGGDVEEDRLVDWLHRHLEQHGHVYAPETVLVRAVAEGGLVGGLSAAVNLGWMHVKLLAVAPGWRGRGVGRRLVERAEAEARRRRCTGIWLDTFGFQAPGFYEALGYAEFGRLPEYPAGSDRIYYAKRLDGG